MEHACRELQKTRDMGHAAALDLVRWVEGTERRVSGTVTTTQPFPALRPEPDSKPSAEPSLLGLTLITQTQAPSPHRKQVSQAEGGEWEALHHLVLRGCAEERRKAPLAVHVDVSVRHPPSGPKSKQGCALLRLEQVHAARALLEPGPTAPLRSTTLCPPRPPRRRWTRGRASSTCAFWCG